MASPQTAYDRTGISPSAKRRVAPSPFTYAAQVRASTLPRHLHDTLCALLQFNRFGSELWASTESIAVATRGRGKNGCICRRSVQYHLDQLVEKKVLEQVYPANSRVRYRGDLVFRHTATYRLIPESLTARRTWEQWQASRPVALPKAPQPVRTIPPTPPAPGPAPAPMPQRAASAKKPRQLTRRECVTLVSEIARMLRGNGRAGEAGHVAPMKKQEALRVVCKRWCMPLESAISALKLAGHDMNDGASPFDLLPAAPRNQAEARRDANLEANRRAKELIRRGFENIPSNREGGE